MMVSVSEWAKSIEAWIHTKKPSAKIFRTAVGENIGIVEIGYNAGPDTFTAALSIKRDDFDEIVHGKRMRTGGILTVQCGFVLDPKLQVIGYPEDQSSIEHLLKTIVNESTVFFGAMTTLEDVLDELTSPSPKFPYADPRAESLRSMFAAAVAFLMGRDWKTYVAAAMSSPNAKLSVRWIKSVQDSLARRSAARSLEQGSKG